MKIHDIITESNDQQVNEIGATPQGLIKRATSSVKAALGSQTGQAQKNIGARANELYRSFREYALNSGYDMKAMDPKVLSSWLKNQQLPKIDLSTFGAGPIDLTDPQTSKNVWNSAATGSYRVSWAKGKPGTQPLGFKYGTAPAKPAPKTGTKTPPAPAPAPAPAGLSAKDLVAAITSMSAADRKAILDALTKAAP